MFTEYQTGSERCSLIHLTLPASLGAGYYRDPRYTDEGAEAGGLRNLLGISQGLRWVG